MCVSSQKPGDNRARGVKQQWEWVLGAEGVLTAAETFGSLRPFRRRPFDNPRRRLGFGGRGNVLRWPLGCWPTSLPSPPGRRSSRHTSSHAPPARPATATSCPNELRRSAACRALRRRFCPLRSHISSPPALPLPLGWTDHLPEHPVGLHLPHNGAGRVIE